MHLVGILCSIGAAVFWAMAVIMFKMSGDVLSPTALNLYKGIVNLHDRKDNQSTVSF